MSRNFGTVSRLSDATMVTNTVLRNTFILLALSFAFSALMGGWALASNAPPMNPVLLLVGYFGLMFLTNALRNSAAGILAVFALTGFLGYTAGPLVGMYLHAYSNGVQLVTTALGGTGVIFFGLATYAMTTKKDFSYMGGFLMIGMMVVLLASLANIFFAIPALSLMVSSAVILLMSGLILFDLSLIINGGQRNYIMATVSIFASLFNIFLNLLQLLAAFAGNRE